MHQRPRLATATTSRRVLVALPSSGGYAGLIGMGIVAYAERHPEWEVIADTRTLGLQLALGRQMGDFTGILLGKMVSVDVIAMLQQLKIPIVLLELYCDDAPYLKPYPVVHSDNIAVGRMAADYLIGRGFRHLLFWGLDGLSSYATERAQGFREHVLEKQLHYHCLPPLQVGTGPLEKLSELPALLRKVPKPVAAFCDNNHQAAYLANTAKHLNLRVPEDVAVLGVDPDEVFALLSNPPLSTLDQGCERIGFSGAQLLDELMSGKPAPKRPILIPPVGVVERLSTESTAVEDPDVAEAVRLIRQNALRPFTVGELARQVAVSRRSLEVRFKTLFGCTIHEQITHFRIEHVKQMLLTSTLPLTQIAANCGFSSVHRLSKLFRQMTGQTASEFRRSELSGRAGLGNVQPTGMRPR